MPNYTKEQRDAIVKRECESAVTDAIYLAVSNFEMRGVDKAIPHMRNDAGTSFLVHYHGHDFKITVTMETGR